jgi:hypothetical protein
MNASYVERFHVLGPDSNTNEARAHPAWYRRTFQ